MDADTVGDAAIEGIVNNLNEFNMSSIAWNNATLLVPTNTTGCLRPGAMPIPMYNFNCGCSQMLRSLQSGCDIPTHFCLRGALTDHANIRRHITTNAQYRGIRAEQLCTEQYRRMSSWFPLSEFECHEPTTILSANRTMLAHPIDQGDLSTPRCF